MNPDIVGISLALAGGVVGGILHGAYRIWRRRRAEKAWQEYLNDQLALIAEGVNMRFPLQEALDGSTEITDKGRNRSYGNHDGDRRGQAEADDQEAGGAEAR